MQSTFQRMYSLVKSSTTNPFEDYLTEVIAPIFNVEKILSSFMNKFTGIHLSSIRNINVSTQKNYERLDNHETHSRPDLVITFENNKGKHLIFCENKLGSDEGSQQLQRYHDHLHNHKQKGYYTYLFYITQKYDPKETAKYTKDGVKYYQLQWFQIFNWLKIFKENLYVKEVLKYMEANELNENRRFTPTDIDALQNLYKLQSMMDKTLDGKVKETFEKLFGKPMQWSNRANQLRNFNRYVLISDQSDWKFIGCGFWFNEDEYPDITVFLEVEPNCKTKKELQEAIELFCNENEGWVFEGPDDDKDEMILYIDKSLLNFLSESDHLESIQNQIVRELIKLHSLKEKYPQLEWVSRG
jgi:hypothetical protein